MRKIYVIAKTANTCAETQVSQPQMKDLKTVMTTYVKSYINPQEAKVAPMMAIQDVRIGQQELVCGPV